MSIITELKEKLEEYDDSYFNDSVSLVSDSMYDLIKGKYVELCGELDVVGSVPTTGTTADHEVPMLSMTYTFTDEGVLTFDGNISKVLCNEHYSYYTENKIDGLAISLIYENNVLVRAATRGDGKRGLLVTDKVKCISDIPKVLITEVVDALEVRGEVYISFADFRRLNEYMETIDKTPYKNPRNAASGILQTLNKKPKLLKYLSFIPYYMLGMRLETFTHIHIKLAKLGFRIQVLKHHLNIESVIEYFKNVTDNREACGYPIDGMVIKVHELAHHDKLGYTSDHPKYMLAYKFKASEVVTKLLGILWTVGKFGTITPVGLLSPVVVCGVTVSRVTLCNPKVLTEKNLLIGGDLILRRAGDCIPEVVEGIPTENASPWTSPTNCPSCNSILDVGEVNLVCLNSETCTEQLVGKLTDAVSKKGYDIPGMSEGTIRKLVKIDLVNGMVDIFRLTEENLLNLPGYGSRSVRKILNNIEVAKVINLPSLIYSLCIPNVRRSASKAISTIASNVSELCILTKSDLLALPDIGDVACGNFIEFMRNGGVELLKDLVSVGVTVESSEVVTNNTFLSGKRVAFTGTLSGISRKMAVSKIISMGGLLSGVNRKTDYLVCGKSPGGKVKKARSLGVTIVDEREMLSWFE